MTAQKSIYISHAWGGTSDEILAELVPRLEAEKIAFIIDKRDLGYRQSIRDFMVRLGKADMVIIILSNKYLKSEYCMFELIQIYHNENLADRIFPIVLDEVKISSSVDRLDFVKYWEKQLSDLQSKVKELDSLTYIEGITEDLNLYSEIRNNIARLTGILRDINTLNITLHKESDYHDLIKAIRDRIYEEPAADKIVASVEIKKGAVQENVKSAEDATAKRSTVIKWSLQNLVIIALALFGLFMLWGILTKSNSLANNNGIESGNDHSKDTAESVQPVTHLDQNEDSLKMVDPSLTQNEKPDLQQATGATTHKSNPLQSNTITSKSKQQTSPPVIQPKSNKENNSSATDEKSTSSTVMNPPANSEKASLVLKTIVITKGTLITARSDNLISSDDPDPIPRRVSFVLEKPIYDGPNVAVPAGSQIFATIVKVRKSDHKRSGVLDLNFDYLLTPGGQKIQLDVNQMHLEAKGSVPYEIRNSTKLQIKTSFTQTIKY